jgi:hypothetical protein
MRCGLEGAERTLKCIKLLALIPVTYVKNIFV